MRKIKYRGRDEKGEWHYGNLLADSCVDGTDAAFISPGFPVVLTAMIYRVDPATVGQFTGLTDKNGTPIYEGDIIGCDRPNIRHLVFYCENEARFMAALNGCIENAYFGVCGLDNRKWIATKEVIGNIHDNPELIEKGGQDDNIG